MNKKELPHGGAIHRRNKLAEERKDVSHIYKQILEVDVNKRRLAEVGKLLSDPILSVADPVKQLEQKQNRASLEIEEIWLKGKVGIITQAQSQHEASIKFNELEKGKPDVYQWLVEARLDEPTKAQQIHDKVFPPIRIAGFRTKR